MKFSSLFNRSVSKDQTKDFGIVLSLAMVLVAYFTQGKWAMQLSILFLAVTIVYPAIFKPFAAVWFGLSELLGTIVSKIVLSIVFVVLVIPIGILRKFFGVDTLNLKKWKKDGSSVFKVRDHAYSPDDLNKPY